MALKHPISDGGYHHQFLGSKFKINLPVLNEDQIRDIVKFGSNKFKLDFIHFSSVMSKSRRLPFFTAVNIDGNLWQNNNRKGDFQDDPRIKSDEQFGKSLYSAAKSDFDRGHLVRREDPEWGTPALSKQAGENTFWFTNCAPQHKDLNQKIWAELEANILHLGADEQNLKVNVFTGPVLAKTDGIFVTLIAGKEVQIPNLFWKVVVWTKSNGKAYAVGFLMSQEKFLIKYGIIKKQFIANAKSLNKIKDEDIFEHLEFKDGKTYQVRIEEIEKVSGLKFNWPGVIKPFKAAPKVIRGIRVKERKQKKIAEAGMKRAYSLQGLTL
ncbi:MAG TPA: DNA/RNA non-specific endonuclease [Saprospiraceae bacterium]|nr:DNA/RNA non-specific endonuclease [Saprospiraceae bacterium]